MFGSPPAAAMMPTLWARPNCCLRNRQQLLAGGARLAELVGKQESLGNLGDRLARVHRGLLEPSIGLGLGKSEPLDEDALGAIDDLPRLELALERLVLLADGLHLPETRYGQIERRPELRVAQRLDEETEDARLDRARRHGGVRSARQQHERAWSRRHDPPRSLESIAVGEPHRQHRHIRLQSLDQPHGVLEAAAVTDHLTALERDRLDDG